EARALMEAVGKLWANGVEIEWDKWRRGKRKRVELPGYTFEEKRYWVDEAKERTEARSERRKKELEDWFYAPVWKKTALVMNGGEEKRAQRWLILEDEEGVGRLIAAELERQGQAATRVIRGECYGRKGEREYSIRMGEPGDYMTLLKELEERGE